MQLTKDRLRSLTHQMEFLTCHAFSSPVPLRPDPPAFIRLPGYRVHVHVMLISGIHRPADNKLKPVDLSPLMDAEKLSNRCPDGFPAQHEPQRPPMPQQHHRNTVCLFLTTLPSNLGGSQSAPRLRTSNMDDAQSYPRGNDALHWTQGPPPILYPGLRGFRL